MGLSILRPRVAIFISGQGSNLQTWLDHIEEINLRLVVSSRKSAVGLSKARRYGIRTFLMSQNQSWDRLHQELCEAKIQKIVLAGFMKIIPENFVQKWQSKIWNIHPSLLPSYPGLEALEKSYQDRAELGITLHEVTEEMDAGPIIWQKKIKSFPTLGQTWMRARMAEQDLMRRNLRLWN